MSTKSFPATLMRGGTSNGLMICREHLPEDQRKWQPILSSAMGSPDSYGRQLNGMGSGISSTSKIMVVSSSDRPDADVDYTFIQVGIKDGSLDMAGNCGNMSSAVGPFALDEGLVKHPRMSGSEDVIVRMWNTNTSKMIESTFRRTREIRYDPSGDFSIDGVPGFASCIRLSFHNPGGGATGKAMPTGNPVDELELSDGTKMNASLTDISNPGVFVLASEVGVPGEVNPDDLEADAAAMARLEDIRRAGARLMGLNPDVQSVPKVVMLSAPEAKAAANGVNIVCRALSMQQAHKAVPLTLALNLGVSCKLPGTLAAQTAVNVRGESTVIAHASGSLAVGSIVRDGKIKSALLYRTARKLMKGEVFYETSDR